MEDLSGYPSEEAFPRPDSMMQTLRAMGYTLETAVADILDNSITAGATRIELDFEWLGKNSTLTIADNGNGMSEKELVEAMRLGSQHPLEVRSATDLGRFGLGLKTASFSQALRLTVISRRKDDDVYYRCWDLDHINKTRCWSLITYLAKDQLRQQLTRQPHGTTVYWEKLDCLTAGLVEGNAKHEDVFSTAIQQVRRHLSMVFHRFLEGKLVITVNGRPLDPWDPFLTDKGCNDAVSQPLSAETLDGGRVTVQPYVLPHHSRLNPTVFHEAAGIRGWNAHQGFYIYRNQRLLVAGDWLGFYKRDEHYKLARIMVDLPNTLDAEWQINILKSVARPPALLRTDLQRIAAHTRTNAVEVYRARGRKLQRSLSVGFTPVWNERVRQGKRYYELNRDHPVLQTLLTPAPATRDTIRTALRLIEETVPVPLIALNEAEKPTDQAHPFENAQDEVRTLLQQLFAALITSGSTPVEAKRSLTLMEPFGHFPHLVELL